MHYEDQHFKIPVECCDYRECSEFVIAAVMEIVGTAIRDGRNKILLHTNLRHGLPMENINKVAGPFVEAWAYEVFEDAVGCGLFSFDLVNVEAMERLNMADIVLQVRRQRATSTAVTAEVDVKATAEDFAQSGRSPNITSYARIRTAYVDDPDYLFVILSLKHRVYSKRNEQSQLMEGVMEVVGHHAYDLKYLSSADISYNPALGTGQLQVRDVHYVSMEHRSSWDFCQLLDRKFLASSRRSVDDWVRLATQHGWIKSDDATA